MGTWNRLTQLSRGEQGWVDWKRSAKQRTRIHAEPTDTDNDVVKAGEGLLGEGGQRGRNQGHL